MHLKTKAIILSSALIALAGCGASADNVRLIGAVTIPGNLADRSGKSNPLEDFTPNDRLGAFGSAIAYLPGEDSYLLLPDRGPADGADSYSIRFHKAKTSVDEGKGEVKFELLQTIFLTDSDGKQYSGKSSAKLRLDGEGAAVSGESLYICDEYKPGIFVFDIKTGRKTGEIALPDKFVPDKYDPIADIELRSIAKGRQPNRGPEGLTIAPDGSKLYAIMQSPLMQDGGVDGSFERVGTNARIIEIDIKSKKTREFLYQLDSPKCGLNEILAINDHVFLVIERDGKEGAKAKIKTVRKIDITGATDISNIASLPANGVPEGVSAVRKSVAIDLLSPEYKLAGKDFPEKIEALASGPSLPDGSRLLIVASDNDMKPDTPSVIYAFAYRAD